MDQYSPSKAIYHTDRIKLLQEGKPISPTLLQVDLEAFCNDNCNFCSYRKEEGYNENMLELIQVKKSDKRDENKPLGKPSPSSGLPLNFADILPEMMCEAGIPAIELTGGGEPTLWKGMDRLLENCINSGIEIGLVTNGSNLSESRINLLGKNAVWTRFSMDASSQLLHQRIHRTQTLDFERRIDNIRKLIQKKKELNSKIAIGISFITNQDNFEDVIDSALFYSKLGVDNIRFSWMYDRSGKAGLTDEQIKQVKKQLIQIKKTLDTDVFKVMFETGRIDLFSLPNDDFNTCYMQRFVWALGADCKIYTCCIMKYNEKFALGDLRETTLKDLVSSTHEKMNGLDVKTCYPCWLRNRNKAIGSAVEEPVHRNFI